MRCFRKELNIPENLKRFFKSICRTIIDIYQIFNWENSLSIMKIEKYVIEISGNCQVDYFYEQLKYCQAFERFAPEIPKNPGHCLLDMVRAPSPEF